MPLIINQSTEPTDRGANKSTRQHNCRYVGGESGEGALRRVCGPADGAAAVSAVAEPLRELPAGDSARTAVREGREGSRERGERKRESRPKSPCACACHAAVPGVPRLLVGLRALLPVGAAERRLLVGLRAPSRRREQRRDRRQPPRNRRPGALAAVPCGGGRGRARLVAMRGDMGGAASCERGAWSPALSTCCALAGTPARGFASPGAVNEGGGPRAASRPFRACCPRGVRCVSTSRSSPLEASWSRACSRGGGDWGIPSRRVSQERGCLSELAAPRARRQGG